MTKVSTWVMVNADGLIIDVHKSNTPQPGMIEWPWNSNAKKGENIKWYHYGLRILDEELVRLGFRVDNRGKYWNENNYDEIITIRHFDIPIPEGFTKVQENIEKKKEIAKLKNKLEIIDDKSGSGRPTRKAAVDIGGLFSAVGSVVMDFANMARKLGFDEFDPDKNEALQLLAMFDLEEYYDLQKITELEGEAEEIRNELRKLEEVA